jgi:hypothetical protein
MQNEKSCCLFLTFEIILSERLIKLSLFSNQLVINWLWFLINVFMKS